MVRADVPFFGWWHGMAGHAGSLPGLKIIYDVLMTLPLLLLSCFLSRSLGSRCAVIVRNNNGNCVHIDVCS
jgi:hypothetical protein